MIRITVASLLLGILALVLSLELFVLPPFPDGSPSEPLRWQPLDQANYAGELRQVGNKHELTLNKSGAGNVGFANSVIDTSAYPFIQIGLDSPADGLVLVLSWKTAEDEPRAFSYAPENQSRESLWLAARELSDWQGQVTAVSLSFYGSSEATVAIRNFALHPDSLMSQLRALSSDWTGFVPWGRAAMNSHSGVTTVATFYPVPLIVGLLTLSLLSYVAILLVTKKIRQFNWQVVGLIFLACWICLDISWQNRLLQQLAETKHSFAGLQPQEKLAVGPDATLYKFIAQAKQKIDSDNARVFVSSSDDYTGLRSAYYLYPHNVYWSLHGPEIPPNDTIHSGDYVLLVKPTTLRFDQRNERLLTPSGVSIGAALVVANRSGRLVRVK